MEGSEKLKTAIGAREQGNWMRWGRGGKREAGSCSLVWVGRKKLKSEASLRAGGCSELKAPMGERRWYPEEKGPLRDQCRGVAHLRFGLTSDCINCGLSRAPHRPDVQELAWELPLPLGFAEPCILQ